MTYTDWKKARITGYGNFGYVVRVGVYFMAPNGKLSVNPMTHDGIYVCVFATESAAHYFLNVNKPKEETISCLNVGDRFKIETNSSDIFTLANGEHINKKYVYYSQDNFIYFTDDSEMIIERVE